jgi:hypothetical protein
MPIINPYTGRKVAEIEKGEAIINRHNTNEFYHELDFINSYKNRGRRFPSRAKKGAIKSPTELKQRLADRFGYKYGGGGQFNFGTVGKFSNRLVSRLAAGGGTTATKQAANASTLDATSRQEKLLQQVIGGLDVVAKSLVAGFGSMPSTSSELIKVAQILKDQENAAR